MSLLKALVHTHLKIDESFQQKKEVSFKTHGNFRCFQEF